MAMSCSPRPPAMRRATTASTTWRRALITLTGHVILTKEKNVMRGTTLTVNLATGEAQLGAKGAPGGRVQGLFTPPPQNSPSPANAAQ